jgi:hypothetical protein
MDLLFFFPIAAPLRVAQNFIMPPNLLWITLLTEIRDDDRNYSPKLYYYLRN